MAGVVVDAPLDCSGLARRLVLAGVAVVAVLCAGFGAQWWLTSASAFRSGNQIGFEDLQEGEQYHVGLVYPGFIPDVTVTRISVELAPGSGDAATAVRACSSPVGAIRGPLPCRARPIEGVDLGVLDRTDGLVLTIVPLQDGPVTVDRVTFEFSDGIRRGQEGVGPRVVIGSSER